MFLWVGCWTYDSVDKATHKSYEINSNCCHMTFCERIVLGRRFTRKKSRRRARWRSGLPQNAEEGMIYQLQSHQSGQFWTNNHCHHKNTICEVLLCSLVSELTSFPLRSCVTREWQSLQISALGCWEMLTLPGFRLQNQISVMTISTIFMSQNRSMSLLKYFIIGILKQEQNRRSPILFV